MKRKYGFLFSLILLLMVPTTAYAQLWTGIIDPSRAIDWSKAGIPAGTFLINGNLGVPSNVTLRGQGADQTILNAKGSGGAVVSLGSGSVGITNSISITAGATAGSTSLTVASASGVSVGSYLLITELNDPAFVSIAGSEGSCTCRDGARGWNGTRVLGQIVEA